VSRFQWPIHPELSLSHCFVLPPLQLVPPSLPLALVDRRLSTVEKADVIFVLEKGHIAEKGNFRELLNRKDGAFARLHQSASFLSSDNPTG